LALLVERVQFIVGDWFAAVRFLLGVAY